MSEADDINAVVRVLRTIPPKKLRIIELINSVPIKNGECEFETLEKLGSQIEQAKTEATDYAHATSEARRAILEIPVKGDE
jgi:hypothetical protein